MHWIMKQVVSMHVEWDTKGKSMVVRVNQEIKYKQYFRQNNLQGLNILQGREFFNADSNKREVSICQTFYGENSYIQLEEEIGYI